MARAVRICCMSMGAIAAAYILLCFALIPLILWPHQPQLPLSPDPDVVANFAQSVEKSCPSGLQTSSDPGCEPTTTDFFFGLATAPAHVEDNLNDSWLEFAQNLKPDDPHVRAWLNIPLAAERLRFWSNPEVEINLAKEAGSTVFRLGVDWGRIVPVEPLNGIEDVVDMVAVEHYQWILKKVKESNMRVMLTLFHHSMPKWAVTYGGWVNPRTKSYFNDFAMFSKKHFGEYVDYWVTFNEPHIFVILSHCSGTWPPGYKPSRLESLYCFTPWGHYGTAMREITEAHKLAYKSLHDGGLEAVVGVAHHVGVIQPYGLLDLPIVYVTRMLTEFQWIDDIQNHLDYCGINYYGQEILSGAGLMLVPEEEYSEAGRGVYPDGLFQVLVAFHNRYKARQPKLRYIITENGFADARDIIRRPYLLEHLLAIHAARQQGVPIDGYLHWTISDNWEWADGYCPKFGLVDVDRSNNLTRHPRPSYYLYQQVSKSKLVTKQEREGEWQTLQEEIRMGGARPFCRKSKDKRMWAGAMGQDAQMSKLVSYKLRCGMSQSESLDTPVMRRIAQKDWRFTKYTQPGFLEFSWRSVEVAGIVLNEAWHIITCRGVMDVSLPPEIVSGEL